MIESCYWKEDLLVYAKKFKPIAKPPRWSEKLVVNFEKDLIICFFMIRKLIESMKLSSKAVKHKVKVYRSPCVAIVNNLNFMSIEELYDFEAEVSTNKSVVFICNQLIHSGAMFSYRDKNRNWGGVYVCSDFERSKYVYRIPMPELIEIIMLASNDYPSECSFKYDDTIGDYT